MLIFRIPTFASGSMMHRRVEREEHYALRERNGPEHSFWTAQSLTNSRVSLFFLMSIVAC